MATALIDRFSEGMTLARKAEHDRAHELLAECVIADPGNIDFVDGMLQNLARKIRLSSDEPEPDEAGRAAFSQAVVREDWKQILRLGPHALFANPWEVATLLALASACAAKGYEEAELRYLKMAYEAEPRGLAVNRHCGRSLTRMKKFDEAINCWQTVGEVAPGDEEAARMVAALSIEKSRARGEEQSLPPGKDGERRSPLFAASPEFTGPEHDTAEIEVDSLRQPAPSAQPIPIHEKVESLSGEFKLTPVQALEAAIRDYPANPEYYVELIPMYLEKGRDYDAERLLAKGKSATDDLRVHQLWEDVAMLRMSRKIALTRQIASKGYDPEAEARLADLCRERDRFETEVFASRSLREPHNAAIRVQLGLRLRQGGKIHEALECFGQALQDPVHKPVAALEMGRSHEDLREFPEALRHYRLAAESATEPEQLDVKKQALYLAGGLARQIKMQRLAQRYLAELVRLDPHYQDATAWLNELSR